MTVGTAAAEVEVAACVETSGAKVAAPDKLVVVVVVVVAVLDGDEDAEEEPVPDPELAPVQTAGPGILYSVKAWYRLKTMPGSE